MSPPARSAEVFFLLAVDILCMHEKAFSLGQVMHIYMDINTPAQ